MIEEGEDPPPFPGKIVETYACYEVAVVEIRPEIVEKREIVGMVNLRAAAGDDRGTGLDYRPSPLEVFSELDLLEGVLFVDLFAHCATDRREIVKILLLV